MAQRLIDANALKEWLVAQIDYYKKYSGYNCNAMASAYGAILERIDNEPTVDAVPVVKCRDCKWCEYPVHNGTKYGCKLFDRCIKPDWFCADGKEKSDGRV